MVRDPYFQREWSETFRDFCIGALLGVNIVILVECGRGFAISPQEESSFIRVIAFGMNVMGVVWYFGLLAIIMVILHSIFENRERGQRRLNLVSKM